MAYPVRIGVVGAGQISQLCHIAPLLRLPGVTVTALADLRPDLVRLVAQRFGIERCFDNHAALLEAGDIDAVVVVTNRPATGPIVRDCLLSGRHVLSEKPLTHSVAQAQPLCDIARARGLKLAVAYMKRHDLGFETARGWLQLLLSTAQQGALRRVRTWSRAGDDLRPPVGDFGMTAEMRPAGLETWPIGPDWLVPQHHALYAAFLNVHVHAANWLAGLLGPLTVRKAGSAGEEWQIEMTGGGAPVSLSCIARRGGDWDEGADFEFERTVLRLRFPPPFAGGACASVECPGLGLFPGQLADGGDWAFTRQAAAFAAAVASERPVAVDGADAVADLQLVEDIWKAALKTPSDGAARTLQA